ncbi:MAG: exopolysaccharide biosynthesis protein [Shinella sp.]|nr:MAG: exopolysaccharide biosynthesis protein [Shinella sp.]
MIILRNGVTMVAFVILGALIVAKLDDRETQHLAGHFRVSDGDTLALNGTRYRLQGIDAPERRQTCGVNETLWPCGEAAREALKSLVATEAVTCEGNETDKYGRLLVICRAGGRNLNAEMVRQGMAIAYAGTDVDYRDEEAEARAARRGVWSGDFIRPQDWRQMNGSMAEGGFAWLQDFIGRFFSFDRSEEWEE